MDLGQQAIRLCGDLQKVIHSLEEERRAREKFEAQHRSDAASWGRERGEYKKALQDQAGIAAGLQQELARQQQQVQQAEQANSQLQQSLRQSEEQVQANSARASAAIRAAEVLQAELSSIRANHSGQMQGGQMAPLHGSGPQIQAPHFDGSGGQHYLQNSHLPPNVHAQQVVNLPQGVQQHLGFVPQQQHGPGAGLAPTGGMPVDPRRPVGPMHSEGSGPHGMGPRPPPKRKPDMPPQGAPPQKQQMIYSNPNQPRPGMNPPPQHGGMHQGEHIGSYQGPPGSNPPGLMNGLGHAASDAARVLPASISQALHERLPRQVSLSNLPYSLTTNELRDLAGARGRAPAIVHVEVFRWPDNRSRGTGVIVFTEHRAAQDAVKELNRSSVGGRTVNAVLERVERHP